MQIHGVRRNNYGIHRSGPGGFGSQAAVGVESYPLIYFNQRREVDPCLSSSSHWPLSACSSRVPLRPAAASTVSIASKLSLRRFCRVVSEASATRSRKPPSMLAHLTRSRGIEGGWCVGKPDGRDRDFASAVRQFWCRVSFCYPCDWEARRRDDMAYRTLGGEVGRSVFLRGRHHGRRSSKTTATIKGTHDE